MEDHVELKKTFQTLKTMRDHYVAEIMKKDTSQANKFRSPDVTAPYYMVCSQVDAPSKLLATVWHWESFNSS